MKTSKLLWVEDDYNDLDPMLLPLKRTGVVVDACSSLISALEHISRGINQYGAILIDLILPKTDEEHDANEWQARREYHDINFNAHLLGVELIRFIRHSINSSIPIVVLSVVHDPEVTEILKKFSVKELLFKSPNVTNKVVCDTVMESMAS